jgi:hypothetical protein
VREVERECKEGNLKEKKEEKKIERQ